jgi:hypothetical protein
MPPIAQIFVMLLSRNRVIRIVGMSWRTRASSSSNSAALLCCALPLAGGRHGVLPLLHRSVPQLIEGDVLASSSKLEPAKPQGCFTAG